MKKAAFALLLLAGALARAPVEAPPRVPWHDGEQLVYRLSWKGIPLGKQTLSAHRWGRGWHFSSQIENRGLAGLVGFEMKVESYTRADLFTRHFLRDLTIPGEGRRLLTASVAGATRVHFVWTDGSVHEFTRPQSDVLDDAAVLYYVRVHPDAAKLWLINFPDLVSGPLRSLGRRKIKTAFGWRAADGYLFDAEGASMEVWYGADAKRWPLRMVFGHQWGGFEAELVAVDPAR